uniref:Pyrroline-5-carboxylate reductase n=1 Tax=Oryza barthii TaxID=65489 RepID=A0A0D3EYN0_9ORYZ
MSDPACWVSNGQRIWGFWAPGQVTSKTHPKKKIQRRRATAAQFPAPPLRAPTSGDPGHRRVAPTAIQLASKPTFHIHAILLRLLLLLLLGSLAMAAPPQPVPAPAAASPEVFRLGFIGPGNLAESIARGVAASATAIRTAPHRRPERAEAFSSIGAHILETNAQVVDDSDVIVISVKPQIVRQVLVELKPLLSEEKLLVSIAAGIKMEDLQGWSGHRRFIRVMPNTPSAVGQAASVMCLGEMATENDENRVRSLFSAIGKVWTAEEKYFDAVTGLSGSGPAYIFLAIEAMADGGVAAGLPRDLALGLASQTVLGAATMVNKTGKHPGQLKDMVTSPAGTTITGIQELEKGAFRGTLINAVVAATKRCRELSQS